jgi:hypothetical protein
MWSVFLSIGGILLTMLVGKKYWWAWLYALVLNFLWCVYSVVTKQYGFLIASVVYFVVYYRNMVEWRNGKD